MRIHIFYILGAVVLATATFFVGRRTGQHSELTEIASDPKMVEAAKAVNTLSDWGKALQGNSKEFEAAEAKRKAEADAEAAAEAKRQMDATDTVQNQDVRIHVDKIYRGKVLAQTSGFREEKKEPLGYDCLLIRYKVENLSHDSLLDASAYEVLDNFGNKLESTHDYDYSDLLKRLELEDLNTEKLAPGESKYRYDAFKQPLPNAKWYIIKMVVRKANGESSKEPLYVKALNK